MKLNQPNKRRAGEPQNHSVLCLVKAQVLRGFMLMTATLQHSSTPPPFSLNKPFGFIFIIAFLSIGIPSMVYAADVSDVLSRFQLYTIVDETYDTNVNLTPTNKKDDFTTTIALGLRFSTLPRSETSGEFRQPSTAEETKYGINLDFLPGYVIYAKRTSDNYLSLSGNLDAWYTLGRKLTFRVRDYLIRSEEPLERNYAAGALPGQVLLGTQIGRPIYIRNVVQPSLEYRFGKEDLISINYLNNIYKNQSPLFEDSTENYINPRLAYWFNIRNGISLEYALDLGNFQRSPDMTGNLARGRYTYRFNPRTSMFGEYIFQRRDFARNAVGVADYNIQAPSIGFEHAFTSTLSLRVQAGYFWQIPQKGSNESGPLYDILITQRAERTTYTLGLQGGYTESYFTAENLGFAKYHQVIGTITHQITQRASATLSARFQRPQYNDGRVDNIWGVGGNASYQLLRWLNLVLTLSYAENHSNRDVNDYTDFRAIFGIRATF